MKALHTLLLCLVMSLAATAQQTDTEYAYKWKGEVIATKAPRPEGKSYRIEVITVRHFNPADPDLRSLTKYGKIYPERNLNQGTIRLMLGNFRSMDEARPSLNKIRSMGFNQADIIQYQDGYRQE